MFVRIYFLHGGEILRRGDLRVNLLPCLESRSISQSAFVMCENCVVAWGDDDTATNPPLCWASGSSSLQRTRLWRGDQTAIIWKVPCFRSPFPSSEFAPDQSLQVRSLLPLSRHATLQLPRVESRQLPRVAFRKGNPNFGHRLQTLSQYTSSTSFRRLTKRAAIPPRSTSRRPIHCSSHSTNSLVVHRILSNGDAQGCYYCNISPSMLLDGLNRLACAVAQRTLVTALEVPGQAPCRGWRWKRRGCWASCLARPGAAGRLMSTLTPLLNQVRPRTTLTLGSKVPSMPNILDASVLQGVPDVRRPVGETREDTYRSSGRVDRPSVSLRGCAYRSWNAECGSIFLPKIATDLT